MVREIEELRRQRDVLQRRIEFCREKEAIGTASRLSELICSYREYTPEVIKLATDDFSEHLRMKTGGDLTNVFKGRINHATVAIKMVNSAKGLSQEAFQIEVMTFKFYCITINIPFSMDYYRVACQGSSLLRADSLM